MVVRLTTGKLSVRSTFMLRIFSLFSAAVFLSWLLPLGVFIAPSQQKWVCGGQRAICMCESIPKKALSKNSLSGESVKAVSGVQKDQRGPTGASYAFIASHDPFDWVSQSVFSNDRIESHYLNPSLIILDHVPKA